MILIKYMTSTCIGFHRTALEILCSCHIFLLVHAAFIGIQNMVHIYLILRFINTQDPLQNFLIVCSFVATPLKHFHPSRFMYVRKKRATFAGL